MERNYQSLGAGNETPVNATEAARRVMVHVDAALRPFMDVLRDLESRPAGDEHEDAVYAATNAISRARWALDFALREAAPTLNRLGHEVAVAWPQRSDPR